MYYYILLFTLLFCITCKNPGTTLRTSAVSKDSSTLLPRQLTKEELEQKKISEWLQKYTIEQKIGQLIMIGINDRTSLQYKDSLISDIQSGKIGGIILFEKNISKTSTSPFLTLKGLIDSCQKFSTLKLFISIDEEGGKVHRLKEKYGFIRFPSAFEVGKSGRPDTMLNLSIQMAQQLHTLGINVNFAPCVDIAVNPNNPIIAKVQRSYSANPDTVSYFAEAFVSGHQKMNIITTLKHFPGHGSSTNDTHKGIADVTNTWTKKELTPYSYLIQKNLLDAVLSCHVTNCILDDQCIPATLSKKITTHLLRDSLGFKGVVFSDDMQMHAISQTYGFTESIKMAINAGVDVLVFGNNVNISDRMSGKQLHETLLNLYKSKAITEQRINEAFIRVMLLKEKYKLI
ncbi:MAG: glycoside hydrolase family 3 protein [Cytophagaceae bacterium]|nr:glycoside hydrolase family 3 protein [Cytophagaceae bacterium]